MTRDMRLAFFASAAIALLTGCGGKQPTPLDTQPLERSFATAAPDRKAVVERAVSAARQMDYQTTVTELSRLARLDNLTPEQRQSLQETINQAFRRAAGNSPKTVSPVPMTVPK